MTRLILASKSPRRIELLRKMGVDFICHPAEIAEDIQPVSPEKFPLILARKKAFAVAELYPGDFVLGVDTIVSVDEQIIGKPGSMKEAREILLKLSGREHKVISGVCLTRKEPYFLKTFTETSLVKFKELNDKLINEYYSHINPLDKAGGYAIQEHGDIIVERIEGSVNNVIGLPVEKLLPVIKQLF